ncbi:MAG: hypothetical protein WDN29_09765 [Methylovirgula sp.]
MLFQIDPVPYQLSVAQAEADLALAEAHARFQAATCLDAAICGDDCKSADQARGDE